MAVRATTLFSLDTLKAYLPATGSGSDTVITQIADGVSARIEAMCGRKFVTRSVTWAGDAKGKTTLRLPDYPVSAITSVKVRTDLSVDYTTLDASAYTFDSRLGIIYLKTTAFYCGPLTCEVVYDAGWGAQGAATLPGDIVQAALDYCKFVYTRQSNGMLTAGSMTAGGASVVVVPEPPKDIRDAIMAYRKARL